jgi:2-iminobutanoate/2-iminopropanoate deaminase
MSQRQVISAGAPEGASFSPAVVAGGFVYVSAVDGLDRSAPAGTEPDIAAETRRALDRLKASLTAAGSSMAQAVNINVFLKRAADFDAMNAIYRGAFTDAPPARTTVVADLADGALVALSAVAVPDGAPRETLLPAGWMKSPRPYSYIVRAGDLVYFSGLVSRRGTDDQPVSGTTAVQVKTILDNAGVLLKTVGLDYSDVVAARVFITDDLYFDDMNAEYRKYFPIDPPARATAIANLMGPSMVEISLVASTIDHEILGPTVSPTLPISTGVRVGPRVFLSGVLGYTDTNIGDLPGQTREMFARIKTSLGLAHLTPADVVDNTVYVTDMWQRAKMDGVYRDVFPTAPPARTVVGTNLVARTGLVECMTIAVAK